MLRLCCLALMIAAGCDVRVGDDGVSLGVGGAKTSDVWERSYTLEPGARLELAGDGGPMTVIGTEGRQAIVRIHLEARASSDEEGREALKAFQIVETPEAGSVKIETRGPRRGERGRRPRVSARFEVQLPRGLETTLRTQNGGIQLENLDGRVAAFTTNGGITGTSLAGAVSASVVNGGLQLHLTSVNGPMELSVVNGAIRLELAPDVAADVEASALNGSVSVGDGLQLVQSESQGGFPSGSRMSGTLNGGGPTISANATNGGVRISARGADRRPASR